MSDDFPIYPTPDQIIEDAKAAEAKAFEALKEAAKKAESDEESVEPPAETPEETPSDESDEAEKSEAE